VEKIKNKITLKGTLITIASIIVTTILGLLIRAVWYAPVNLASAVALSTERTERVSEDKRLDDIKLDSKIFYDFQTHDIELKKMENDKECEIRKIQSERLDAHSRYIAEINKQLMDRKHKQ
jgi:hypothetical protein